MILLAAAVVIAGALASAAAPGFEVLTIARVVIGVAIGLASAAAPVYISEAAPPESRGRLARPAAPGGAGGAGGRGRPGDPAAGNRDQHRHLLRADDRRIHRDRILVGLDPGRGRS